VKLSPGTPPEALEIGCEREFVGVRDEARELVLWCGALGEAGKVRVTEFAADGSSESWSASQAAMEEAFRHDSAVILEETIPGFEVGCAVMGNEELTVGLVDEIALSEGFFNYEEKYTLKTSAIHCPARIPPEKAAEIQAAAKTIYRALDCRVFARVDLFLTPDGEIVFNEVNTIPGFTAHSRYPSMMQGIGISFGELVTRLIELGVAG
jgi:D-alanine---D-serine ligase